MFKIKKKLLVLFLPIISSYSMEIKSSIDSIQYHNSGIIKLRNTFIIPESVTILDSIYSIDSLDFISGNIYINNNNSNLSAYIKVKYEYLSNEIPIRVGNKWNAVDIVEIDPKNNSYSDKSNSEEIEENDIFTNGSIYRKLILSKFNGSEFSGGMQMQLSGDLGENTNVSGVLNDEGGFLQADGYTKDLQDFDQIYLNISNNNFLINAGNIVYNDTYYNQHVINRKLTGIKNKFVFKDWQGSSTYATSRGVYNTVSFKGKDGKQGPYRLLGKNGEREIVILSGSETVWINGEKIVRGYLNDYTIDYSLSEINFTSNILISEELDIFIEYQYNDNEYSKGFSGGFLTKKNNKNIISFGLYRNKDQVENGSSFPDKLSLFNNTSNSRLKTNTSQINPDGEYILIDSVFVYDPEKDSSDSIRYNVSFTYDQFGYYSRKVSSKGTIYYQFEEIHDRVNIENLYSPHRYLEAPKNHKFGFLGIQRRFGDKLLFDSYFSGSIYNKNALSNLGNNIHAGSAYNLSFKGDSIFIGDARIQFNFYNNLKDQGYLSFDNRHAIDQQYFWNESKIINNGIKQNKGEVKIFFPDFGVSTIENSSLTYQKKNMKAYRFKHHFSIYRLRNSFLDLTRIYKPQGLFQRIETKVNLSNSKIRPFIHIINEHNPLENKFNQTKVGLRSKSVKNEWLTSIEMRENKINTDSTEISFIDESKDMIGSVSYRTDIKNDWTNDISFKKRIKTYTGNEPNLNYLLSRIKITYKNDDSPLGLNVLLKTEESSVENRLIVYDSVGIGLGQYRYEPTFNTYVPDKNGSYIAYAINNGLEQNEVKLEGYKRISYDFGKINNLKLIVRSELNLRHQGESLSEINLFKYKDVDGLSQNLTKIFNKYEIDYYDHYRTLFWLEIIKSYDGKDPRGKDIERSKESGIEISPFKNKNFSILSKSKYRDKYIKSTVSEMRNRNLLGWFQEIHFLYHANNYFNLDLSGAIGNDGGGFYNNNFNVMVNGFTVKIKLFIKKIIRIENTLEIFSVTDKYNNKILPPEIFNGLTTGKTIKSNTRAHMFLNNKISLILSLNTIDDKRYKNLLTFQGEIRANF